jgi:hypothetical protein
MRKQFNPETTRRMFLLEQTDGKWALTCHDTAWIARLAMKQWLYRLGIGRLWVVESARLGTNTTDYVTIRWN